VKTKWGAGVASPEAKGSNLKTTKEQRLFKGVSFKEGSVPLDADDAT